MIEPGSQASLRVCLSVFGGGPCQYCNVVVQSAVTPYSGYHQHHDSNRPKGFFYEGYSPDWYGLTQGDGCTPTLTWQGPAPAGDYGLQATGGGGSGYASIQMIAYQNPVLLQLLPNSPSYTKKPPTANHPAAYYGTANVNYSLERICSQFKAQFGYTGIVNDMSLAWGGTFDLGPAYASATCPSYAAQFWTNTCAHAEHRWGLNVDVPFSGLGSRRLEFKDIAEGEGAHYGGPILNEGNHYHLRFGFWRRTS